jgi:hypothetical protein
MTSFAAFQSKHHPAVMFREFLASLLEPSGVEIMS